MQSFDGLRAALRRINGDIVSFDSRAAPQIHPLLMDLARGQDVSDSRLRALQRPAKHAFNPGTRSTTFIPMPGGGRSVAVVSVRGMALYSLEMQPYAFSTLLLAKNLAALAADPSVDRIVLDIDTPGGEVTGTPEAADAIWSARRSKPVVGIVNPLCASAGYWIASQCTKLFAVPSADVGSIGVFVLHVDQSKMLNDIGIKPTLIFAGEHKTEGNSFEPLSAGAKAYFQSRVDQTYKDFLSAVARGRGTTPDAVKTKMGGGRCVDASAGIRAGMIDAIAAGPDAAIRSIVSAPLNGRKAVSSAAEYRARLDVLAAEPMSPSEKARRADADRMRRRIATLGA